MLYISAYKDTLFFKMAKKVQEMMGQEASSLHQQVLSNASDGANR